MAQIRKGTVRLVTGSTTVRHVWTGFFTSVAGGPYIPGETVTWAGGGAGTALRYVTASKTLMYVRTAGPLPAIGTVITGGTSGAVATIAEMGAGDPPNWDILVPASQTVALVVSGAPAPFFLDGTPPLEDAVDLSVPWPLASIDEASYGLQISYYANGLPIIEQGDVGAALLVSYGFGLLSSILTRYVHVGLSAPVVLGASGTIAWNTAAFDPEGWLEAGGVLRVPPGVSLIDLTCGLAVTGGASFYGYVTKNDLIFTGSPVFVGVMGLTPGALLSSGPIAVQADDEFRILYTAGGAPTLTTSSFLKLTILA